MYIGQLLASNVKMLGIVIGQNLHIDASLQYTDKANNRDIATSRL